MRNDLVPQCRARDIEAIPFEPGDDLTVLAAAAIDDGADALGALPVVGPSPVLNDRLLLVAIVFVQPTIDPPRPVDDNPPCTRHYALVGAARHDAEASRLLARGVSLERVTLGWNVVGVFVLGWSALAARSVALAGFGLDSVIEIGASIVVLWELSDRAQERQQRALRLIGAAFVALAIYVAVQSTVVLFAGHRAHHSTWGIVWTGATAAVMFALAQRKALTGEALRNPVLQTEGRVTFIDGLLATAVLVGLLLNATVGAWWADPLAGYVVVFYGLKEANAIFATRADG